MLVAASALLAEAALAGGPVYTDTDVEYVVSAVSPAARGNSVSVRTTLAFKRRDPYAHGTDLSLYLSQLRAGFRMKAAASFVGRHRWRYNLETLPDGRCRTDRARVLVNQRITMPSFDDAVSGVPARPERLKIYLASVLAHEMRHKQIYDALVRQTATILRDTVAPDCDALEGLIAQRLEPSLRKERAEQRAFDNASRNDPEEIGAYALVLRAGFSKPPQ